MIPLYFPYYAPTNAAALVAALHAGQHQQNEKALKEFFRQQYGFHHVFFTKSCTHALETIALMLGIQPGDEVIVPSYTYVSTAGAFALHGAKIVFADSNAHHPNVDTTHITKLITPRTRAVVVMHYAGVPVEGLETLRKTCDEKGIMLVEDAAHCLHAFDKGRALGNVGHAAVFSFHESKNLGCAEGGMLVLQQDDERVEALLNKGTNRAMFERNEVAIYEWVAQGSSYRMDNLHLGLLKDQLQYTETVTAHRVRLYDFYLSALEPLRSERLIDFFVPATQHNAHIFWIRLRSYEEREALRIYLLEQNIFSTFHYLALHKSPYGKRFAGKEALVNAEKFEAALLRIPLYYPMPVQDAEKVAKAIRDFFGKR